MQKTIGVGVSMPRTIVSKIDAERGDISRSRYLLRILEKTYPKENKRLGQGYNKKRSSLQTGPSFSGPDQFVAYTRTALESDSIHE